MPVVGGKMLKWKDRGRKKPLLIRGARQTGKTWILRHFGRAEYQTVHYFNFEEDAELSHLFAGRLRPSDLITRLQLYTGTDILPGKHLIILDEIQHCDRALNSLKYFAEDAPDYHVAAAGSLLGIHLSDSSSFPVGKVDFADLYPMSFLEFLNAMGDTRYCSILEDHPLNQELATPFHHHLIERLREYYYVGGMPEVVSAFVSNASASEVRSIQKSILDGYELDFAKHSGHLDAAKLSLIWNSVPHHLSRENHKFIFSALRPGARARNYEEALKWLEAAGLVLRCSCVHNPSHPLAARRLPHIFKIYCMDIGLLAAMAGVQSAMLVQGDAIFTSYSGAFVENYVAQQISALSDQPLAYWKREGNLAEVDFLHENEGIIPIEVKAGINPRSQSLRSYRKRYSPQMAYRLSLLNFCKEAGLVNLPLYAAHRIPGLSAK